VDELLTHIWKTCPGGRLRSPIRAVGDEAELSYYSKELSLAPRESWLCALPKGKRLGAEEERDFSEGVVVKSTES
jgi:hypothetical protein